MWTEAIRQYVVQVVRATRDTPGHRARASPRGSLFLQRRPALAAIRGAALVIPDDVKYLAPFVWHTCVMISPQARTARGRSKEEIVADIVGSVPRPVESAH